MGLCQSVKVPTVDEHTKRIDEIIKEDKDKTRSEIKLLLLGAGESGKSTVFKQMKIIHSCGFPFEEREQFVSLIRKHTLDIYHDVARCALVSGLLSSQEERLIVDTLDRLSVQGPTEEILTHLFQYWENSRTETNDSASDKGSNTSTQTNSFSALKQACRTGFDGFHIPESAEHFLDNLLRIMNSNYVPTDTDILMCRVRTSGITEMEMRIDGTLFRVVDVGGQRNERRKWIHCFQDVHGVIFVSAINEYDQVLFEDDTTNRLHESLRLFEEIANTKFFSDSAMILFLNKRDLFEEKIKHKDLKVCFPDYTDGNSYDHALEFIKQKFRSKTTHELFIHVTCATSTGNVRFVFESVRESMLMQAINSAGML